MEGSDRPPGGPNPTHCPNPPRPWGRDGRLAGHARAAKAKCAMTQAVSWPSASIPNVRTCVFYLVAVALAVLNGGVTRARTYVRLCRTPRLMSNNNVACTSGLPVDPVGPRLSMAAIHASEPPQHAHVVGHHPTVRPMPPAALARFAFKNGPPPRVPNRAGCPIPADALDARCATDGHRNRS